MMFEEIAALGRANPLTIIDPGLYLRSDINCYIKQSIAALRNAGFNFQIVDCLWLKLRVPIFPFYNNPLYNLPSMVYRLLLNYDYFTYLKIATWWFP